MNLLDTRNGFCAEDVRDAAGASLLGSHRRLGQRVARIERVMAYALRVPTGFTLEDNGKQVDFAHDDGRVQVTTDNYIDVTRDPNKDPHNMKLALDTDQLFTDFPPGCTDVLSYVYDVNSDTYCNAVGCNSGLSVQSSDGCINVSVSCNDSGGGKMAVIDLSMANYYYNAVQGNTGTASAASCSDILKIQGTGCISTVAADGAPDTLTISYTGMHFKTLVTDSGSKVATACDDSVNFLGGTCIATRVTGGNVYFDYTGHNWSTITTDSGSLTPAGCDSTLQAIGGTCISTSVSAGKLVISFTGNVFSGISDNAGNVISASGCGSTVGIIGTRCIETVKNDGTGKLEIRNTSYWPQGMKDQNGNTCDLTSCGNRFEIVGDNTYIRTVVTPNGDDCKLTIAWCTQDTACVRLGGSSVSFNPAGWLQLCHRTWGTVAVPYWRCS